VLLVDVQVVADGRARAANQISGVNIAGRILADLADDVAANQGTRITVDAAHAGGVSD